MSDKIPSLAETCELHWNALFEAIQELTGPEEPIHACLEARPLEDGLKKEPAVDNAGNIREMQSYPIDNFFLYITAGERPLDFLGPVYLGSGRRVPDPDSNKFAYSPEVIVKLRHEIGLRLGRLKALDRDVYLTSKLLGYEKREAAQEFIGGLLNSESKELGIVTERILE